MSIGLISGWPWHGGAFIGLNNPTRTMKQASVSSTDQGGGKRRAASGYPATVPSELPAGPLVLLRLSVPLFSSSSFSSWAVR